MSYPWIVACLVVSGVFAASVHSAVRTPDSWTAFVGSTASLARRRRPAAGRLAVVVVVAESAAALALAVVVLVRVAVDEPAAPALVGPLGAAAGTGGAALLLVLAVALRRAQRDRPGTACHCFGAADEVSGRHVVRNVLLAVLALVAAAGPATSSHPHPAGVLLCCVVAVVATEAVRRLDDLSALLVPASRP